MVFLAKHRSSTSGIGRFVRPSRILVAIVTTPLSVGMRPVLRSLRFAHAPCRGHCALPFRPRGLGTLHHYPLDHATVRATRRAVVAAAPSDLNLLRSRSRVASTDTRPRRRRRRAGCELVGQRPVLPLLVRYVYPNRSRLQRGRIDDVCEAILADIDNHIGRTAAREPNKQQGTRTAQRVTQLDRRRLRPFRTRHLDPSRSGAPRQRRAPQEAVGAHRMAQRNRPRRHQLQAADGSAGTGDDQPRHMPRLAKHPQHPRHIAR
jgi:hypothetical protein